MDDIVIGDKTFTLQEFADIISYPLRKGMWHKAMDPNKFCFAISAYRQADLTELGIRNIRENFVVLKDSPIILLTTSSDKEPFHSLVRKYPGVSLLHFQNAPGQHDSRMDSEDIETRIEWRKQYLCERVLLSMEKLFCRALMNGSEIALHLHSDSAIYSSYEDKLLKECDDLLNNDKLFYGDLSLDDADSAESRQELPRGAHWHPEMVLLNLYKAYNNDYILLGNAFTNKKFQPHNRGSVEELLGSYAEFCLSGNNFNSWISKFSDEYKRCVVNRIERSYHGIWEHGGNLAGMQ